MTLRQKQLIWWGGLALWALVTSILQAEHFWEYTSPYHVMHEMNDIRFIALGFDKMSGPVACIVGGFTGKVNQEGIQVYRPLANILAYFELNLGRHTGWLSVAWLGIIIHIITSWIGIALAWHATRSRVATIAAAIFAPQAPSIGMYSKEWALWFPCHPEMVMMAFLFGTCIFLQKWLDEDRPKYLRWAFVCFVLGLLTKEFFVIAPFMCLAFMATHPAFKSRIKRCLQVSGSMLGIVAVFMVIRRLLLTHPRNPMPLKWVHFYMGKKILFWLAHPFYMFIPDPVFNLWYPGMAILILVLISLSIRSYQRWPALRENWYGLPVLVFTPLSVLLLYMQYCALPDGWAETAQWIDQSLSHPYQLVYMMGTAYSFYLLYKYRNGTRAFSAFWLLVLVYVPSFTMDGWHYGMAGAILRGAFFWPVVIQLAVRDVRPYFQKIENFTLARVSLPERETTVESLA